MDFWAFRKLDIHEKIRGDDCKDKCDAFLFLLGGLIVPCGIFMLYLFSDLAQVFLFACIACSVVAILTKARPWKKLCKCECKCVCDCDYSVKSIWIKFTVTYIDNLILDRGEVRSYNISPEMNTFQYDGQ